MKVCLLTCAKNEDEHIEEFLDHYFNIIGIDHMFWIDNNSEPLKPVNINDNRVTVIDKRYINFDNGEDKPIIIMKNLINEIYQEYIVNNYDWCIYVDPDELLDLNDIDIHSYLKNENHEVILAMWAMHGNNNYIWESELPSNKMKINYGFKDNYDLTKMEFKPIFRVRQEYELDIHFFNPERIILNCDNIVCDKNILLHHYRIQCLETFIKHKIMNGFYGHQNRDKWCRNLFASSLFRKSNVLITKEKTDSFKQLLIKYNLHNFITDNDKLYLYLIYNIKFN